MTRTGHYAWRDWAKRCAPPILVEQVRRYRRKQSPGREFLLPVMTLEDLFPGIDSRLAAVNLAVVKQLGDDMTLPARELLTLAMICRYTQPRRIFEIGTYTGISTLVLALNSHESVTIHTLDMDPTARASHAPGPDIGTIADIAPYEVGSAYRRFPGRDRIHQLYGNSITFDYCPYHGAMDLIFVDADHSYPFVSQDTNSAFRMVNSRGLIVWDDYVWREEFPECAGVAQCLHEIERSRPLYRLDGTRLAIYVATAE
jgi:predicted O-methyltransferase YrrM